MTIGSVQINGEDISPKRSDIPSLHETALWLTIVKIQADTFVSINSNPITSFDLTPASAEREKRANAWNIYIQQLSPEMREAELALLEKQSNQEKNAVPRIDVKRELRENGRRIQIALATLTLDALNNPGKVPTYFDQRVSLIDCVVVSNDGQTRLFVQRQTMNHGQTYDSTVISMAHGTDSSTPQILLELKNDLPILFQTNENTVKALGAAAEKMQEVISGAVTEGRVTSNIRHYKKVELEETPGYKLGNGPNTPPSDRAGMRIKRHPDEDHPHGGVMAKAQGGISLKTEIISGSK